MPAPSRRPCSFANSSLVSPSLRAMPSARPLAAHGNDAFSTAIPRSRRLGLGEPDPGDLGVGVGDRRDRARVERGTAARRPPRRPTLPSCIALCASSGAPVRSPIAKTCGTFVRCCASTGDEAALVDAHAGALGADPVAVRPAGRPRRARGRRRSSAGALGPSKRTRRPAGSALDLRRPGPEQMRLVALLDALAQRAHEVGVDARRAASASSSTIDHRASRAPGRRSPARGRSCRRRSRAAAAATSSSSSARGRVEDARVVGQARAAARCASPPRGSRARTSTALRAVGRLDARARSRPRSAPRPVTHRHLALLRERREPAGEPLHDRVLARAELRRSRASARRTRRRRSASAAASSITSATCSSAFDGMQPTFRQTPPSAG